MQCLTNTQALVIHWKQRKSSCIFLNSMEVFDTVDHKIVKENLEYKLELL